MKSAVVKLANLLGELNLYQRLCPGHLPVFMLHRVYDDENAASGGMHANQLRDYLGYLADRNYRVLSMEEVRQIAVGGLPVPSKSVAFTIDDGFYDHYQIAARVFDEFGFPLNFFVITGFLDRELWPWDDQVAWAVKHASKGKARVTLPDQRIFELDLDADGPIKTVKNLRNTLKTVNQEQIYNWIKTQLFPATGANFPESIPPAYVPMTWDDARDLVTRGHGVYPHTCSHRILSTLAENKKGPEINESRRRVEEELGAEATVFAYPTGRRPDYDASDISELEAARFSMAFNTVPDYLKRGANRFELPRFSLPESPDDFRQIVNRFEAFKSRLRS